MVARDTRKIEQKADCSAIRSMPMRVWAPVDPISYYNNVSASYTRNFSPTFLNELLIGVNRNNNSSGTLADFTDWPKELGFPILSVSRVGPLSTPMVLIPWGYWDSDNRGDQQLTAVIAEDNATWIKGKHTFQFGGKYRPEQNNVRELQQAQGSHTWGGGSGQVDFTLGSSRRSSRCPSPELGLPT